MNITSKDIPVDFMVVENVAASQKIYRDISSESSASEVLEVFAQTEVKVIMSQPSVDGNSTEMNHEVNTSRIDGTGKYESINSEAINTEVMSQPSVDGNSTEMNHEENTSGIDGTGEYESINSESINTEDSFTLEDFISKYDDGAYCFTNMDSNNSE